MKSFAKYKLLRESEDQAVDSAQKLSDEQKSDLMDIAQAAWEKHRAETLEFFNKLAQTDAELKSKLQNLQGGGLGDEDRPSKVNFPPAEVHPSSPDGSPGLEDGNGSGGGGGY